MAEDKNYSWLGQDLPEVWWKLKEINHDNFNPGHSETKICGWLDEDQTKNYGEYWKEIYKGQHETGHLETDTTSMEV